MAKKSAIKLHLACGPNLVKDWDNVDILQNEGIIVHDLRNPLPYKGSSVDVIFHEHFIEHLSKTDAVKFLEDCNRVLKKGAVMRIGWPDMKKLINAFVFRRKNYMDYVLPHLEDHRFGKSWDEMVSDCLFGWEHRYAYTANHLMAVVEAAGFTDISIKKAGVSDYDIALDFRRDPATTYIEAVKK